MADLKTAAKDALDYLTTLHKLGDIDGQVGGEIMSQLTEALESAPTGETNDSDAARVLASMAGGKPEDYASMIVPDPTLHTTPTRDEAVPFCVYCANRRTYERDDGAIFPCKHCKPTHAMMMASGPETRAYALASAPAPASGGVDAVDFRSIAVAAVDSLHGYTFEFSAQPAAHLEEYDTVESVLRRELASLSPAATPVSEAGTEWRWRIRPDGSWSEWCSTPMGKIDVSFYEVETRALAKPASSPAGVREGRSAVIHAVASLAAAISLLERTPKAKKAAPSDRMFEQMLKDYRKALTEARDVLNAPASESARQFAAETWGDDWVANEWASLLEFVSRASEKENLPQVRHLKRQSTYDVLGEGTVQISEPDKRRPSGKMRELWEGNKLVVYRAHSDGTLWIRFPDEFEDGRFEKLD